MFRRISVIGLAPLLLITLVVSAWMRLSLLDVSTNYLARSQSQVIADALGILVATGQSSQIAEVTRAMGQYPVIGEVAITPHSLKLASYRWRRPDAVMSSGVEVPITYNNETFGVLAVQGDARYLDGMLRMCLLGFVTLVMLQWLLTMISARRYITRSVLRPLDRVRFAIDRLVDAQDKTAIPPLHEGNEFDEIIDDIETARGLIRTVLSGLEDTVAQRTEELTEINDQLIITRDEFVKRERLASLGNLVAGVAHELNTPIGNARLIGSSLAGSAERFLKAAESGIKRTDLNDYLAVIRDATPALDENLVRAAELINRFKTMSIDQTTGQRRHFALTDVVAQSVLAMRPQLKKTSIGVSTDIPDDIHLDSVPGAFSQVLTNLIENSLIHAYAPDASGTLSITARRQKDRLLITYEDDGRGVSEDTAKHVFEPFYTTRRGQGGSGLGLHIVWTLVHSLGGEIHVEGRPGIGARFILDVPLQLPPDQPKSAHAVPHL